MRRIFQKILLTFFLGLILPQLVFAADIFFGAKTNEVRIGEQFEVKLFVNTPEESVNAFEGKITFPGDLVKVKEIRDGNSIINFWINKPKADDGAITFSGITPGGFQGNNSLIFSVIFEAKSEGVANFEINNARVLRNDGAGSQAVLTVASLEMKVSSRASATTPTVTEIKDTELPESFAPAISRDDSIANGKWFIVFATQDKASGIDHFEIKESRQRILNVFEKWITAESPYVLMDQELRSYVWIKAVDKVGNERIAIVEPRYPLEWYKSWQIWSIIILGLFVSAVIGKILWKKHRK